LFDVFSHKSKSSRLRRSDLIAGSLALGHEMTEKMIDLDNKSKDDADFISNKALNTKDRIAAVHFCEIVDSSSLNESYIARLRWTKDQIG